MKKTQFTDAIRNCIKQRVSFLSIVIIALLAVTTYLGISYAAAATADSASVYYGEHRMWDIEIVSTLLMDEDDLAAIRAVEGVELAESMLQVPGSVQTPEAASGKVSVNFLSLPQQIAQIDLLEGRLPEKAGECAVEEWLIRKNRLAVGQRIEASCSTLAGIDPLVQKSYVITGVFRHPDHISWQVQVTPYILLQDECFNLEALDGAFMKTRVLVENTPADRYGKAYWDVVDPVCAALTTLAEERETLRAEKLRGLLEGQLDEGREKLAAADEQLRDARAQLDDGWAELAEGEKKLADAKDELDSGKQQLDYALLQITQGEEQLKKLEELLALADSYLMKGKDWILANVPESSWPPDIGMSYAEFISLLDQGRDTIMAMLYERSGYNAGAARLAYAKSEYEKARNNWFYYGEEYLDGQTRYEQSKAKLEQGELDYAEGLRQYEDGQAQIAEAQRRIDQVGQARWIVFNNLSNAGYVFAKTNSGNIASLSTSFSLIFIIIGALVIYASVGRMVEEQSKLVGATKAMGLFNREIFGKYLLFGGSSTMIGVLLGVAASYFVLQNMVLNSQKAFLNFGKLTPAFLPVPTLLIVLGGALLSVLAVWLACTQLLRAPAIQLMQGSTNLSALGKAHGSAKGSLYSRLILLNMRSDSKRVLVTIASIAGCCILLVIGFAVKFGISRVNDRQFGPTAITRYDAELYFDTAEAPDAEANFARLLSEHGLPAISVHKEDVMFKPDATITAGTLICADPDEIGDYFALTDVKSGQPLRESDSGMLIPNRLHEAYRVNTGDRMIVYNGDMDLVEVQITGVFRNHFGQLLFFSPAAYREAFGMDAEKNCFLVKTGSMSLAELEELASSVPGFQTIKDAAAEKARFNQLSSMISYLILLMIVLAGLMAYFIIVNLSKTYIQKKSRELTIMRINGFTVSECIRYAAYDLIVTTVIGTAIGLVVGGFLGKTILCMMEQPYIQFVREPDWRSFVLGALITFLFSWLINALALRRVKDLKLSDIA